VIHTPIQFSLNGEKRSVAAHPMEPLLDVLRRECGATGTKYGCGEGECGACSVIINGELAMSCMIPACQAADATIETIEGLARDGELHPVQQAFLETGGAQCGICTPGMVLAAVQYIRHPERSPGGAAEALEGNLCRCTGYSAIFRAVELARSRMESA